MRETLNSSEDLIKECLRDLYLEPRSMIRKWAEITNQTCQVRLAYPGQHVVSLITGIKGIGSAARGDDLSDGSEIKTCSRADQLSECKDCNAKVPIFQQKCPICGSTNINIKEDSHWIFPIKSEDELELLLGKVPRIILVLFDKESHERDIVRIRVWVIDPQDKYVRGFFEQYFHDNYQKKVAEGKKAAPCNLHPLKYDFYLMNPMLIFQANIDTDERDVRILFWSVDVPMPEQMPSHLLNKNQLVGIFESKYDAGSIKRLKKSEIVGIFPNIPEEERERLEMREKTTKEYKEGYKRR